MIAFGSEAAAYASRIAVRADALVVDLEGVHEALAETIRRRARGRHVELIAVAPERRARNARHIVPSLLANVAGDEQRRAALDALAADALSVNGRPVSEFGLPEPAARQTMRQLCLAAGEVRTRSQAEAERLAALTLLPAPQSGILAAPDVTVPAPQAAGTRRHLLVWAPHAARDTLGVYACGLERCGMPVEYATRELDGPRNAALLADAACVLVAYDDDPAAALALAGRGLALAVPACSGAHELIAGAVPFVPWDRHAVEAAARRALAAAPAVVRAGPAAQAGPVTVTDRDALVSIVVPTMNRPGLLERALASIAAQRYPHVEAVVVNDAGESVDALVARFACAKLITHERNRGLSAARNTGLAAAAGRYVGFLDDDDALFPDHAETSVAALERSGRDASYGDYALCFIEQRPDGRFDAVGVSVAESSAELEALLVENRIGNLTVMARRGALEQPFFDETLEVCEDYEAFLRLALRTTCVHTGRVTTLYSVRTDAGAMTNYRRRLFAPVYRALYARYPVPADSRTAAARDALLAQWDAQGGEPGANPGPLRRFAGPVPLAEFDGFAGTAYAPASPR